MLLRAARARRRDTGLAARLLFPTPLGACNAPIWRGSHEVLPCFALGRAQSPAVFNTIIVTHRSIAAVAHAASTNTSLAGIDAAGGVCRYGAGRTELLSVRRRVGEQ